MTTKSVFKQSNPSWWSSQHTSNWDRVKDAMQRDWDQTKHDFGGKTPDTHQSAKNTVNQAMGKEPIPPRGFPTFKEAEYGYRFGFGAADHYRDSDPVWNEQLEAKLKKDWDSSSDDASQYWEEYRPYIRRGWDYHQNVR